MLGSRKEPTEEYKRVDSDRQTKVLEQEEKGGGIDFERGIMPRQNQKPAPIPKAVIDRLRKEKSIEKGSELDKKLSTQEGVYVQAERQERKEVRGEETTGRKEIALERRADRERLDGQFLRGKEALEKKASPSDTSYRIVKQDPNTIDRVFNRAKRPVTVIDRDAKRKEALAKRFGNELAQLKAEKEARRS